MSRHDRKQYMMVRYCKTESEGLRLISHLLTVTDFEMQLEDLTEREKRIHGRKGRAKDRALGPGHYNCKIVIYRK